MEGFFFCCRSTVFFFKQIRYLSKPVYILALVLSRSNQGRCNIIKTYQDPRHMTSVTYRPLFKRLASDTNSTPRHYFEFLVISPSWLL